MKYENNLILFSGELTLILVYILNYCVLLLFLILFFSITTTLAMNLFIFAIEIMFLEAAMQINTEQMS